MADREPSAPHADPWLGARWALGMVVGLAFVFSVPYELGLKHAGRYLVPILAQLDPELFPDDPVVAALARFGSAFYVAAGAAFRAVGLPPDGLAPVWTALYGVSRLTLAWVLWWWVRSVEARAAWPFAFLAAWAAFPRGVPLGSVALFLPMLSHDEVAVILGLAALALVLARREVAGWGLLAATLWVHPLVAGQLAWALLPAVAWRRGVDRRLWLGAGLLAAGAAVYLGLLAPPPLENDGAETLIALKAAGGHVAWNHQPPLAWPKTAVLVAAAGAVALRRLADREPARLMVAAMLCGVLASVAVSVAAAATASAWLVLLQPMRGFLWVHLLAVFLLAWAAGREVAGGRVLAVPLASTLAFLALGSLWAYAAATLTIGLLFAGERWIRPATLAFLTLVATVWALGPLQPFASLQNAGNLVPVFALVPLLLIALETAMGRNVQRLTAALLVAVAAVGIWGAWHDSPPARDREWREMGRRIASATAKDDRFLTASGSPNFRLDARRVSATEEVSALVWVAPEVFAATAAAAEKMAAARRSGHDAAAVWDLGALGRLAEELDADWAIVDGPTRPPTTPRHRVGELRWIALPRESR